MFHGRAVPPDAEDRCRTFSRRRALAMFGAGPLVLAGCSRGDKTLVGTSLGGDPAPDFTLVDHRGETIRLSELAGNAVALTFIFTHCPDICPAIAVGLRSAYEQMDERTREKTALLAITVDPERDSADALREFSVRYDLDGLPQWHALGGSRRELEPIWAAYGIDPGAVTEEVESHLSGGGRPYLLSHTDAVYVVDPSGKRRVLLRSSFSPQDLARNLDILAA